MQRVATLITFSLFLIFCSSNILQAAPKYVFKIASLAPTGSVWVDKFESFAKEVGEKTGGEVGFRIYPGGVMGDDQAMYRKMRVGQLHGGGFTMTGISAVVPDFRVLATPFLFESYDEVDYVKKGLIPVFKKRFQEKGLEFIAMTEVGFLYAMSTKPIYTLQDQQEAKNWSPSGDPMSEAFFSTLGITPVQLTISDVLSSLQSGLIDTVYNSLYGSIVLQWFTKTRYIVDMPFGYAYGAFAIDGRKFAKLPDPYKQAIHAASQIHFPVLLEKTRESNRESRKVLMDHGNEFINSDKELADALRSKSKESINSLIPGTISKDIHSQTMELLDDYRSKATTETPN